MNYSFTETGISLASGETIPYDLIAHERNKFRFSHSVLVEFSMPHYKFQYVIGTNDWAEIKNKIKNLDEIYLGQNPIDDSEVVFDFNENGVTETSEQSIVLDFIESYGLSKKDSFFDIIESIKNI